MMPKAIKKKKTNYLSLFYSSTVTPGETPLACFQTEQRRQRRRLMDFPKIFYEIQETDVIFIVKNSRNRKDYLTTFMFPESMRRMIRVSSRKRITL